MWSNKGKEKIKRTAWGAELPGNNFPPLCELAFIRLQQRHLETLQHKSWFAHIGERQEQEKRDCWRIMCYHMGWATLTAGHTPQSWQWPSSCQFIYFFFVNLTGSDWSCIPLGGPALPPHAWRAYWSLWPLDCWLRVSRTWVTGARMVKCPWLAQHRVTRHGNLSWQAWVSYFKIKMPKSLWPVLLQTKRPSLLIAGAFPLGRVRWRDCTWRLRSVSGSQIAGACQGRGDASQSSSCDDDPSW